MSGRPVRVPDRLDSSDGSFPAPITAVVDDVADRAFHLPVALVDAVGAAAAGPDGPTADLESIETSVASLSAHARLGLDLVAPGSEPPCSPTDALLASDYLLASAHRHLAASSLPTDRRLSCYRVLTAGSSELTRRAAVASSREREDDDRDGTGDYPGASASASDPSTPVDGAGSVRSILSATACELGAAAVGASSTLSAEMRTYGEALTAALEAAPEDDDAVSAVASERVRSVLADGDRYSSTAERPIRNRDDDRPVLRNCRVAGDGTIARRLEQARDALDRLEESTASRRLERALAVTGRLARTDR